jgi:hypothetical protein
MRPAYCSAVTTPVDRPLTLGELLAETVRIYGERVWTALGLGAIYAGTLIGSALVHIALHFAVASIMLVGLPFVLASSYLLLVLVAALWIAFVGFAVPVAVVERTEERSGWAGAVAYALERTLTLARAEYLHAAGVAAALLLVNLFVGIILRVTLVGFADNTAVVAGLIAQLVLAPFVFIGLSVLYFEQRARAALSSPRKSA